MNYKNSLNLLNFAIYSKVVDFKILDNFYKKQEYKFLKGPFKYRV